MIFLYPGDTGHSIETMRGKRPNTEYFLVRIQENTEKKAVRVALKQLLLLNILKNLSKEQSGFLAKRSSVYDMFNCLEAAVQRSS